MDEDIMPFFNSLIRDFFDLDASIKSMPVECTTTQKVRTDEWTVKNSNCSFPGIIKVVCGVFANTV